MNPVQNSEPPARQFQGLRKKVQQFEGFLVATNAEIHARFQTAVIFCGQFKFPKINPLIPFAVGYACCFINHQVFQRKYQHALLTTVYLSALLYLYIVFLNDRNETEAKLNEFSQELQSQNGSWLESSEKKLPL